MTLAKKLPVRSTLRSNRGRRSMFRIGNDTTPQSNRRVAHNGIVARLWHYMTHSREVREGKSAIVPVPTTTTAAAFRSHVVNWMRKRKNFPVNTHVISEHEIAVWIRKAIPPAPAAAPSPWRMDSPEPLVKRKNMSERKRKQYRPRAGVPTESMPFDTAIAVTDALGFAPLWPAGDAAAD